MRSIKSRIASVGFLGFAVFCGCNAPNLADSLAQSTSTSPAPAASILPAPSPSPLPSSLPASSTTCTGSDGTDASTYYWAFAAGEKGAQKVKALRALKLTEFDLFADATGASRVDVAVYADGAHPEMGAALASASVTNPSSGFNLLHFTFQSPPSFASGASFYVVFWATGAGPTYVIDSDPGFPPPPYQSFQTSTIWDNSGAGGTWESLGSYVSYSSFSYSASGSSCPSF